MAADSEAVAATEQGAVSGAGLLGRSGGLGRRGVEALLAAHGLTPSRGLGQNYVVDPNTIDKIVRVSGVGVDDAVVEIGPGLGSLTLALARQTRRVVAIERDERVGPALREVLTAGGVASRVEVIHGDALELRWLAAVAEPFHVVANLPYNVAAPLVLDLLAAAPNLLTMTVMVQREVGERLAADPGARAMGAPSVKRAFWADAAVVMPVSRSVFVPEPRVDSVVLRILRRPPADSPESYPAVAGLIDRAFRGRRKMLRASLAEELAPATFERAGVLPTRRAEELSIGDWCRLARARRGQVLGDGA